MKKHLILVNGVDVKAIVAIRSKLDPTRVCMLHFTDIEQLKLFKELMRMDPSELEVIESVQE